MTIESPKHQIKLDIGSRVFSAFSNHSQQEIFSTNGSLKQWNRIVLLIHGFPDNNTSFHEIYPVLESSFKRRVLLISPLLRGYETSSQGELDEYKLSDLAGDIKAWIELVNSNNKLPLHLVGHDWGALATFKASYLYPEMITSLVTLAIPYLANIRPWEYLVKVPIQLYNSSYMLTMQFPSFYRDRLQQSGRSSYLNYLWNYWSPTYDYSDAEIESVRNTLFEPGVIDAATAYYRCLLRPSIFKELKWDIDFDKVPTLILGGQNDGCMSEKLYALEKWKLRDVENVNVKTISHVGHFLHRENPVKVGELIADWFSKYSG